MVNFIEDFLYMNAPADMPKGSYGQYPISEGFKSELGISKKFPYEGFNPNYAGKDKTGFIDYAKKGLQSIFGNVPNTGIGGGTVGQRIIYENILRQLGNANRFANIFSKTPVIGAASDVLFGTQNTRNSLDFLNNLFYTPQQNLQQEQKQVMTAGRDNLNQTLGQVLNQQTAARNPNRGNVQAPTMTAQQIVQEAKDTGGTVNPFEVTKAAQNERNQNNQGGGNNQNNRPKNSPSSRQSSYSNVRRYGRADGGMVSLMDLLNRRV
tara:strand:+ start:286 stop:1080 length:795 start_codon:yes stop_codon:yes gene_type:complete